MKYTAYDGFELQKAVSLAVLPDSARRRYPGRPRRFPALRAGSSATSNLTRNSRVASSDALGNTLFWPRHGLGAGVGVHPSGPATRDQCRRPGDHYRAGGCRAGACSASQSCWRTEGPRRAEASASGSKVTFYHPGWRRRSHRESAGLVRRRAPSKAGLCTRGTQTLGLQVPDNRRRLRSITADSSTSSLPGWRRFRRRQAPGPELDLSPAPSISGQGNRLETGTFARRSLPPRCSARRVKLGRVRDWPEPGESCLTANPTQPIPRGTLEETAQSGARARDLRRCPSGPSRQRRKLSPGQFLLAISPPAFPLRAPPRHPLCRAHMLPSEGEISRSGGARPLSTNSPGLPTTTWTRPSIGTPPTS